MRRVAYAAPRASATERAAAADTSTLLCDLPQGYGAVGGLQSGRHHREADMEVLLLLLDEIDDAVAIVCQRAAALFPFLDRRPPPLG